MLWAVTSTEEFRSRARYCSFLAAGIVLALFTVWSARVILLLLFAAILGAMLLTTLTDWTRATLKVPRLAVLILVLIAGAAFAILGFWLRGAALAEQFYDLQTTLPIAAHKLYTELQSTEWGGWLFAHVSGNGQQGGGIGLALSRIGGILISSAAFVTGAVLVGMASLYFAAEPECYLQGLRLLTPPRYHDKFERGLEGAASQLRWWLFR